MLTAREAVRMKHAARIAKKNAVDVTVISFRSHPPRRFTACYSERAAT
jgi:hypothetical protein